MRRDRKQILPETVGNLARDTATISGSAPAADRNAVQMSSSRIAAARQQFPSARGPSLLRPRVKGAAAISIQPKNLVTTPAQASGRWIGWPPRTGAIEKASVERPV